MAKYKDQNKKKAGWRRGKVVTVSGTAAAFGAFADVITSLVDRIGLTGAVFFAVFWFVITSATDAQRQQIIDRYLLWKDLSGFYPVLVLAVVSAAVVVGQHHYYRRKLKVKNDEIDRLSDWKSNHQQGEIDGPLHHTD